MTVYEMIQELAEFPPDAEVIMCVDGQGLFEEPDTGKERYVFINNKDCDEIGASYERGGKCCFDVTI